MRGAACGRSSKYSRRWISGFNAPMRRKRRRKMVLSGSPGSRLGCSLATDSSQIGSARRGAFGLAMAWKSSQTVNGIGWRRSSCAPAGASAIDKQTARRKRERINQEALPNNLVSATAQASRHTKYRTQYTEYDKADDHRDREHDGRRNERGDDADLPPELAF